MTRNHMGKSEFDTEARAALEDDIDRCPICALPFKADDVCADDITEGTCHAECLEGSPVVDLETGDELPDGKVDTYLYREVMEPQIRDESGSSAGFELTPEAVVSALTIPPPQTHLRGLADAIAERMRQREVENWSPEHDDKYTDDELTRAARCYLIGNPGHWPWDHAWWKPTDRRRDLIKAAALIIAEIERLDRASTKE